MASRKNPFQERCGAEEPSTIPYVQYSPVCRGPGQGTSTRDKCIHIIPRRWARGDCPEVFHPGTTHSHVPTAFASLHLPLSCTPTPSSQRSAKGIASTPSGHVQPCETNASDGRIDHEAAGEHNLPVSGTSPPMPLHPPTRQYPRATGLAERRRQVKRE
ncbi:hypothetical protein E2C01_067292 [Portunus trituberculatus]|uniref:Uncharacterized protein n=1 Tax=Portunus trituberculatus TaxID=210409 RepID=A0A5B7HTD5_PORTR|nr:hypothetical protein [Portunus trituberculatus]